MGRSHAAPQIKTLLTDLADRIEQALAQWVTPADAPQELARAMRYAVLGGGKRLRPALVLLSASAASDAEPAGQPMPAAVSVELVHCYSLVHDDLPAMDDDALRRGRPTVHVKFGQAMAILVGDALLTRAFAVLAEQVTSPSIASALVAELARAAGAAGMIAGQTADMALCTLPEGPSGLEYIHARKTADLFAAAARMGAICAGASDRRREALGAFGADLGLAFQITDDLLDVTAGGDELGKTAGKDAAAGKRTYPGEHGVARTVQAARHVSRRAVAHLESFGPQADRLRELAESLVERTR